MKQIKLYNVIFPIWVLMFYPPIIFITLIGNFIIDSLVVIACFYVFKLGNTKINLKTFYRESIAEVWKFGFLADIIGAAILLLLSLCGDFLGLPYELIAGISYDPFSNAWAVIIILFTMFVSGFFIFKFNYKNTFKELIADTKLRFKIAITIAIVTIPWTFLVPTKYFFE
ncbi:hypothetical protein [Clostridium brassicae]|uniref:Uncharacterized protein n=1 Tax=Clostridium brassicae TaxID=2999072 RepID=A0ABT4D7X8_9CLOT|nr:hypothetical protein [Clostridium brassicae]MCY6958405.1 hypothetical protein [Clostridium brassicae]